MNNPVTLTIFLPLVAGFILLFIPNRVRFISKVLALVLSVITLGNAIWIFAAGRQYYSYSVLQIGDFKLDLILNITPLSSFILLFAMGFGLLITVYSLKSMAGAKRTNEYFGAILLTIGGSAGILLTDHLLFLVIFWEIVTAALYILITTGGKGANFAATKSFAMIGASDAALLLGVVILWVLTGTFEISKTTVPTVGALPIIAFLLLMTAAITKAGALPLHTWLPTSGEFAPASVMALLPAAVDKLLGIYLLVLIVRELFVFESAALGVILAIIGSATIVIAGMVAIVQHNAKKLLAYSAVSQVGYMVLGIATGTPIGLAGAVFHMLNNAIYKCCLFLAAGSVERATGTTDIDRLGGLGKKMPLTFGAFLIAALSVSGVPPFSGFASKWMVYQSVIEMRTTQFAGLAKLWPICLTASIFGSALTLAYCVKVTHSMFLSRLPEDLKDAREASPAMTIPMLVLAALCVLFGVFYQLPLRVFVYPALGIEASDVIYGTWQSGLATALIVVGIVLGVLILIIGHISKKVRVVPTWTCGEIQTNEQMTVPGTHFYKTISEMGGLKQLYSGQEKGYFDPYDQSSRVGLALTGFLRWLHSGVLPMYLTWVTIGLLVVLFVICRIW